MGVALRYLYALLERLIFVISHGKRVLHINNHEVHALARAHFLHHLADLLEG